jgi:hypothetical protein
MFLMRAAPLRGQVGPGNREFVGPCELNGLEPIGECHFRAQKTTPTPPVRYSNITALLPPHHYKTY